MDGGGAVGNAALSQLLLPRRAFEIAIAVIRDIALAHACRHSREGGNPWTFHALPAVRGNASGNPVRESMERPWIPAFAGMTVTWFAGAGMPKRVELGSWPSLALAPLPGRRFQQGH